MENGRVLGTGYDYRHSMPPYSVGDMPQGLLRNVAEILDQRPGIQSQAEQLADMLQINSRLFWSLDGQNGSAAMKLLQYCDVHRITMDKLFQCWLLMDSLAVDIIYDWRDRIEAMVAANRYPHVRPDPREHTETCSQEIPIRLSQHPCTCPDSSSMEYETSVETAADSTTDDELIKYENYPRLTSPVTDNTQALHTSIQPIFFSNESSDEEAQETPQKHKTPELQYQLPRPGGSYLFVTGGNSYNEISQWLAEDTVNKVTGYRLIWDCEKLRQNLNEWKECFLQARVVMIWVNKQYIADVSRDQVNGIRTNSDKSGAVRLNHRIQHEMLSNRGDNNRFLNVLHKVKKSKLPSDLCQAVYVWPQDKDRILARLQKMIR